MHKYLIINSDTQLGDQFTTYLNGFQDSLAIGCQREYSTRDYHTIEDDLSSYAITESVLLDEMPDTLVYCPTETSTGGDHVRELSILMNLLEAFQHLHSSTRFIYNLPATVYSLKGEVTENSPMEGFSKLQISQYVAFKAIAQKLEINYVTPVFASLLWHDTPILREIVKIVDSGDIIYLPSLNFMSGESYVQCVMDAIDQLGICGEEYIVSLNQAVTAKQLMSLVYTSYTDLGLPVNPIEPIELDKYLLIGDKAARLGVIPKPDKIATLLKENVKRILNERV